MPSNLKRFLGLVAILLQFVVFLLVTIATPLDVLRHTDTDWHSCYSMWGWKLCGNHATNPGGASYKGFKCKNIRDTMDAAAAFAVTSIFLTLTVLILAVVRLMGVLKIPRVATKLLCAAAFCTILVSWSCILGARSQKCPKSARVNDSSLYSGFALLVTGWAIELVVFILTCFT